METIKGLDLTIEVVESRFVPAEDIVADISLCCCCNCNCCCIIAV